MIEYAGTGTFVAAQLDYAGFKADPDKWLCCDGDEWTLQDEGAEKWRICAARHPTYRADTLLAWLVARGWDISIGKPHDKVLIDAASMKENKRMAVEENTLSDGLAAVIIAILDYPPGRAYLHSGGI
jgi:hypothetical protein